MPATSEDDSDYIDMFIQWNNTLDPATEEPFPAWVSAILIFGNFIQL